MNRRGFFKALAATALIAAASTTRLGKTMKDFGLEKFTDLEHSLAGVVPNYPELGKEYAAALARSMQQTKEFHLARTLNKAFHA